MLLENRLCDLRGSGRHPRLLRYPAGDLVVVSGLPGSGKSTLLRRARCAGRVDSQQVREAVERRLPVRLPYGLYRPLVRAVHYWLLLRAVAGGGSLLVHDCGAVRWVRAWLGWAARRQGRSLHLVLLDATPDEALEGQRHRGRTVSARAFRRHRAGWRRLLAQVAAGGAPAGAASAVLLDRAAAAAAEIEFG